MPPVTQTVENEEDLAALAARLAGLLRKGDLVTLRGDLGAGKTALCRYLIRALAGFEEEVPSPTFTLVQVYDLPDFALWHFDLYRLAEEERDILELGWEDARRDGVALVEWPDRLGGLLPPDRLEINLRFIEGKDTARALDITPCGTYDSRAWDSLRSA